MTDEIPDDLLAAIGEHIRPGKASLRDDGEYIDFDVTVDGESATAEFIFNQLVVGTAEYDEPDEEVTASTTPASTERVEAYLRGASPDDPDAAVLGGRPASLPDDAEEFWDRSLNVEVGEDFLCATGHDDADPVSNQYDAYWVLTKVETDDEVLWKHPNR